MLEARDREHLALESRTRRVRVAQLRAHDLERDLALQVRVLREIHHAHATLAEGLEHPVGADGFRGARCDARARALHGALHLLEARQPLGREVGVLRAQGVELHALAAHQAVEQLVVERVVRRRGIGGVRFHGAGV